MKFRYLLYSLFLLPLTLNIKYAFADSIFFDDFESGDLSKTANGFTWGSPNTRGDDDVSVVEGIAHSGSHSLRFHFSGVPDGTDNWAEARFDLGSQFEHIFMSFWIYYPNGSEPGENTYYHRDSSGPDNNKLFRMWDTSYNDGDIHLGYSTNPRSDGGDKILEKHHAEPFGASKISEYSTSDVGWYNSNHLGKWNKFEFQVSLNTPGVLDGVTRMWVNGTLVHEATNLNYSDLGQGPTNFIQHGYLMGWANSGFDEDTNVYIDDIQFYIKKPKSMSISVE